eukprot:3269955-Rhodomonas_salina.2
MITAGADVMNKPETLEKANQVSSSFHVSAPRSGGNTLLTQTTVAKHNWLTWFLKPPVPRCAGESALLEALRLHCHVRQLCAPPQAGHRHDAGNARHQGTAGSSCGHGRRHGHARAASRS